MTNRIMELAEDVVRASCGLTVIDLQKARDALQAEVTRVEAELAECKAELADRVAASESVQRLTRELDVLLNGKDAAPQASLCDIVSQVARLAALEGQEPVAWADDAAINGRVGNVCSTAAKRYWEKSDWVDRKNAELHKHPLYAGAREAQPLKGADWTITMRRMLVAGKCARRECRCAPENAEHCIWWDEPDDAPKPLRAKLATKPMTEAESIAGYEIAVDMLTPQCVWLAAVRWAEAHYGIKGARE